MESTCVSDAISDPRYFDQRSASQPQKPDQSGMVGSLPFNMCNMFFQGYNDCAHEALRFLIEDEGLPYNHPMVSGLFEYLRQQQRLAYIQYCLRSAVLPCNEQTEGDGSSQKTRDECESHDGSQNKVSETANYTSETNNITSEITNNTSDTEAGSTTILNAKTDSTIAGNVGNSSPSNEAEKLAVEIAEELYCLLQNDDFLSESEELDDEGFEEDIDS